MTEDMVMPVSWWSKYLTERIAKLQELVQSKAQEYAEEDDRMHNFNRATDAAAGRYKSREAAIFGMMLKHWVSILDILDDNDNGIKTPLALIREKFGDQGVYTLLMEASLIQTQYPETYKEEDDLPF